MKCNGGFLQNPKSGGILSSHPCDLPKRSHKERDPVLAKDQGDTSYGQDKLLGYRVVKITKNFLSLTNLYVFSPSVLSTFAKTKQLFE